MAAAKPILCLDFDGVIHSHITPNKPWRPAWIPDPPVPGCFAFIRKAQAFFTVAIYSSRSHQEGGLAAMQDYVALNSELGFKDPITGLLWPLEKPPAFLTIDDRVLTFKGEWWEPESLLGFKPWNKP